MGDLSRRNFFGNLLVAGAGFLILPAAKLERRIWVPDRTIVTKTATSIWRDYYMSHYFSPCEAPNEKPTLGKLVKKNGRLWYGTPLQWFRLEKLTRPLTFLDRPQEDPPTMPTEFPDYNGPIPEISHYG